MGGAAGSGFIARIIEVRPSPLCRRRCSFTALFYFDHNATTFVAPEVADTMIGALRQVFGNASSTHREGQLARQQLEKARRTVAASLRCSGQDFVFTSGGTESDNLAILGLVRNLPKARKHVVTTAVEHPAVLEPCRQLEREGVDVTYVKPGTRGLVSAADVASAMRDETVLVSVMHANNEVGTIQPIAEIAAYVRERSEIGQTIFLHSDGVQAFGKIPVDVTSLGVDLYSVSGHKVFAPKGIGGLYVRKGVPLRSVLFGGRHERERRAGTENVPAAMAFARAVELCGSSGGDSVAALRDFFETEILSSTLALNADIRVNGDCDMRLPNTSNLLFAGLSAEAMVIALDMKGMSVSTGSACSSGSVEPSHVLLAMGLTRDQARSSVRFSFGRYNTGRDIELLLEALSNAIMALRATPRLVKHVVV